MELYLIEGGKSEFTETFTVFSSWNMFQSVKDGSHSIMQGAEK
jgi:hypothetical protein